MNLSLKNKTAIITGASQGIGKAIAELFAKAGANLILLGRNESNLKEVSSDLNAEYHIVDISSEEQILDFYKSINHVDILVNNAGLHFCAKVEDINEFEMENLFKVNVEGLITSSREAVKIMLPKKYGRIINISSTSGKLGKPLSSAYAATKAAVIGYSQSLAQEVAREGITVNSICPWMTETQMIEKIFNDKKYVEFKGSSFSNVKENAMNLNPLKRFIKPEEIAYMALYLASEYSGSITGQAISVSGGPQFG